MKGKRLVVPSICLLLGVQVVGYVPSACAKKWTIYERQVRLVKEIDAGKKSGDLTLTEAADLKVRESKISDKIEKMKGKNGGKLSYADENKIEKDLNHLSLLIQKHKLEKRVQH